MIQQAVLLEVGSGRARALEQFGQAPRPLKFRQWFGLRLLLDPTQFALSRQRESLAEPYCVLEILSPRAVESLNQGTINTVREEFKETAKDLNKNVSNLVEKEFPKYKKFFAETELKTEETIKNAIDSYKETIESLNAKVKVFTETEIPKYNNLLIETKLKSEQEVKELEEEVLAKVNSLSEKVDFVSGDVTKNLGASRYHGSVLNH